ncbi:hypothetical protein TDB9533_02494 [Thalassocella blandensis]|nr:hypothetical protein TDB9533_02494 [Thalassocella blandensis]
MRTIELSDKSVNLHHELKASTQAIHEQLHTNPTMLPLLSPQCTLEQYKRVLACFYTYYHWAESLQTEAEQSKFSLEANVCEWLQADISAMKMNNLQLQGFVAEMRAQCLDDSSLVPHSGFEQYLGFLYVKQGSLLGGQVIASFLNKSLHLVPGQNLFLFSGYQKKSKAMWQQFLMYLEACSDQVDRHVVIESALGHFHVLKQILDTAYQKRNDYVF